MLLLKSALFGARNTSALPEEAYFYYIPSLVLET